MNVGKGIEEDEVMDGTVDVEISVVGFEIYIIVANWSGNVMVTTQATRNGNVKCQKKGTPRRREPMHMLLVWIWGTLAMYLSHT